MYGCRNKAVDSDKSRQLERILSSILIDLCFRIMFRPSEEFCVESTLSVAHSWMRRLIYVTFGLPVGTMQGKQYWKANKGGL